MTLEPTTRSFIVVAPVLFVALFSGCGTTEISDAKQERYFARANNAEARVKNYVERYNWAKDKAEEYEVLVEERENELAELRVEVAVAREGNDKRAAELAGLTAEAEKLTPAVAERKKAVDDAKAAVAASEAELAALRQRQAELDEERAAMLERVRALEEKLPAARLRLARIEELLESE